MPLVTRKTVQNIRPLYSPTFTEMYLWPSVADTSTSIIILTSTRLEAQKACQSSRAGCNHGQSQAILSGPWLLLSTCIPLRFQTRLDVRPDESRHCRSIAHSCAVAAPGRSPGEKGQSTCRPLLFATSADPSRLRWVSSGRQNVAVKRRRDAFGTFLA